MLVFISLLLTFKLSQYSDALNLISYGFNVKKKIYNLQTCDLFREFLFPEFATCEEKT